MAPLALPLTILDWEIAILTVTMGNEEVERVIEEARNYAPLKLRGVYSGVGGREGVDRLVEKAREAGFNLIVWFVNPRWGEARYRTNYFPCGADCRDDLLSYMVERAHENGIKVWAWFGFMGYRELLEKHPDWAAMYPDGSTTLERPCKVGERESYYPMNPANPEVVEFWKRALLEVVENYDVDGINFEDDYGYSYCGQHYSFDEYNRRGFTRFLEERGFARSFKWPDDVLKDEELKKLWVEYKCKVVENLTRELYSAIKNAKPGLEVSLAISPNLEWSKIAYGVDWIELGRQGLFDALTFMVYTADDSKLEATVRSVFALMKDSKTKPIIIIGWELKDSPPAAWVRQALLVRKLGGEDIVVFWDGGLDRTGSWEAFAKLFKTMGTGG
jgi:uncharacterized lipoprotein YddW (UPF0748 family)